MTVAELIAALQMFPGDAEVLVDTFVEEDLVIDTVFDDKGRVIIECEAAG